VPDPAPSGTFTYADPPRDPAIAATRASPGKRNEDCDLPDPAGQGVDAVRPIRFAIRAAIRFAIRAAIPRRGAGPLFLDGVEGRLADPGR
jgi:hypothetical protein